MIRIPTGLNVEMLMQIVRTRATQTILNCLNIVRDECYKSVPVDSGELRNSIKVEPPRWITPFMIQGKVLAGGEGIPQAWYMERGTPGHGPVFAQAMHFNYKGVEVFAKWVKGVEATHWMRNAVTFSIPRIQAEMGLLAKEFLGAYTVHLNIKGA